MLNRYPLWKYIMLILVLVMLMLYALPNLYGEDPAIQITGIRGNTASQSTLVKIKKILEKNHIANKSITLKNGSILIRFINLNIQLRAKEILIKEIGKNYIVALNLAPATPSWLVKIGASPMKLGLDLLGGVHFLLEVDIDTTLNKIQEQLIDTLRGSFHEKNIPYFTMNKLEKFGIEICFLNATVRDQARALLQQYYHYLIVERIGDNIVRIKIEDNYLKRKREYAIKENILILRNRVNQLGISESLVQNHGDHRIVVELPGIQDTARAKEILGATATLEFHLVNTSIDQTAVNDGRLPEDSEIKMTRDGQTFALYKAVILSGDHITDSTFYVDEYNRPEVNIYLDGTGGQIMSEFTKNNIGNLLASLFVEYKYSGKQDIHNHSMMNKNEEIINIATIQSRLGRSFRITGIKNHNEARQLSLLLRSGALIAPIHIIEERIIGPTLGLQNISRGIKACFSALVASILLMIIRYRIFGIIASTALIANLIMIIGIMSLLPGATLTMPGIAGIVLTLAVAIDANVLINERIKEELHNSVTAQEAIHKGYSNTLSSIIDANITTLMTTVILYIVGTGSIKGFAITTMIGIATSMFTSIIGTRAIVNLLYGGKYIKQLSI